jgi:hypothetical protein
MSTWVTGRLIKRNALLVGLVGRNKKTDSLLENVLLTVKTKDPSIVVSLVKKKRHAALGDLGLLAVRKKGEKKMWNLPPSLRLAVGLLFLVARKREGKRMWRQVVGLFLAVRKDLQESVAFLSLKEKSLPSGS